MFSRTSMEISDKIGIENGGNCLTARLYNDKI